MKTQKFIYVIGLTLIIAGTMTLVSGTRSNYIRTTEQTSFDKSTITLIVNISQTMNADETFKGDVILLTVGQGRNIIPPTPVVPGIWSYVFTTQSLKVINGLLTITLENGEGSISRRVVYMPAQLHGPFIPGLTYEVTLQPYIKPSVEKAATMN